MYKIKITKTERRKYEGREYQQVSDTGNPRDNGPVYDYVPLEKEEEIETTVLSQSLEEIDLPRIIKAVNQID